jgi:bisphosphoglycerate-dependent phosphoglycerate mutase
MPTGYTAAIKDGISFKDYVLRCSKAIGYFYHMRDDDLGKPPVINEDTYYQDQLKELIEKMKNPDRYSIEEYNKDVLEEREYKEKRFQEVQDLREKYEQMLKECKSWDVPSELDELKKFMIQQIESSIDFDCDPFEPYQQPSYEEWKDAKIKKEKWSFDYYSEEANIEQERNEQKRKWFEIFKTCVDKL